MFYSSSIESEIKTLYNSLSEKDKRRYAAIEAQKLGWGGTSYIMKLCGCSQNTIVHGIKDLETMNEQYFGQFLERYYKLYRARRIKKSN